MDIFYNIHDFARIKINQGKLNLADGYSHYFRHFKNATELSEINYEIKEFSKFKLPKEYTGTGGILGFKNGVYFSAEKYAITFDGKKVTEYTTYANRATNFWLQFLFLKQNLSLVHCAGVEINGKGIIFPAFGGVGKTILISELRKLPNFNFFGDDYVIVDKNSNMYSYPSDFSIYHYHLSIFPELKNSVYSKYLSIRKIFSLYFYFKKVINFLWRRLTSRGVPLLPGWSADYIKVPVKEIIGEKNIGVKTKLTTAIFLDRYSGDEIRIDEITLNQLTQFVDGILWLESKHALPYMVALASFGLLDTAQVALSQQNIIKSCFMPLKRYRILIPDKCSPDDYIKFMTKFIQERII